MYNTFNETENTEHCIAAFIIEYKASYKLIFSYIYKGLNNMEFKEMVCCCKTNSSQDHFCCLVIAIIA